MRSIGLDVHRDFCEVAIITDGVVASAPRVPTTPQDLLAFAQGLQPTDQVVLENTGNARAIAGILEPHVARVAIANPLAVKLIAHARVKTDRIDALVLAQLLAAGFLPEVHYGDEDTRALRRRVSRRGALVKGRTAAKNEIHAVLMRTLTGRPPVSDLFGKRGRAWLRRQILAPDEVPGPRLCTWTVHQGRARTTLWREPQDRLQVDRAVRRRRQDRACGSAPSAAHFASANL